jgi:hypothetical protein
MSLQALINLASDIYVDYRNVTGRQMTRSGILRVEEQVSRVPFRVTLNIAPQPYTRAMTGTTATDTMRGFIANMNTYLTTPQTVELTTDADSEFLQRWSAGPVPASTGAPIAFVQSFTGTTLVVNGLNAALSGLMYYRAGDYVSFGNTWPYPFVVTSDVLYTAGATSLTVPVHRPNFFLTTTVGRVVQTGQNVLFRMVLERVPSYKIVAGAQSFDQYGRVANKGYVVFDEPITLIEYLADSP